MVRAARRRLESFTARRRIVPPMGDAEAARHFIDRYAELSRKPDETEDEAQARALKGNYPVDVWPLTGRQTTKTRLRSRPR